MKFQSLRGMNDLSEPEVFLWRYIEKQVQQVCECYSYSEVRTPLLEAADLFKRGVGDSTDIVEKEMYIFTDRNQDLVAIRPEGTASMVRAAIQNHWVPQGGQLRLFYYGPMLRHEKPQRGRLRQHHQFGFEIFGTSHPAAEIELISLLVTLFTRLEIKNFSLHLGSIGCSVCRPPYRILLTEKLQTRKHLLCEDCQRRMQTNPLRVFDCKVESCQAAIRDLPTQADHLCEPCRHHFGQVEAGLRLLEIEFEINPRIVRGIDYYSKTTFEFISTSESIGSKSTLCGGGRYDDLFSQLGGKPTPGVGCGMGMERLILLLQDKIKSLRPQIPVAVICADETSLDACLKIATQLRSKGIRTELDLMARSFKAQMKWADKLKVHLSLILGSKELEKNCVVLRDMKNSTQKEVSLVDFEKEIIGLLQGARNEIC